jgi:uncharacterized protein (TIGR02996 family)
MSTEPELHRAVTNDPEDDAARLAYADCIESMDKDRASFIREQIAEARARRAKRTYGRAGKSQLLVAHEREWARTLLKYAADVQFDRGFVHSISIEPYLFLEYGEWLFLNAPIREVRFTAPDDDDPFPMSELAASPLLERLDAIIFGDPRLGDDLLKVLAASPRLTRLVKLSAATKRVDPSVYELLAAQPLTRKAISLHVSQENFPGQQFGDTGRDDLHGRPIWDWLPVPPTVRELEEKYGYVPWLHGQENAIGDSIDEAYYVAQGILPVRRPGSREHLNQAAR